MPESFNIPIWKERVAEWWRKAARDLRGTIAPLSVRTAYGLLTASAFLPLLAAYAGNQGPAAAALLAITSGVGTNLLSNLLQGVYDKSTASSKAEQEIAEQPALRPEYQQMLKELGVLGAAQAALGDQWAEFEAKLRQEMQKLGGSLHIETGGGAVILGDVKVKYGDFVAGDKTIIAAYGERSVVIGGNASDAVICTGDYNAILSPPERPLKELRQAYLRHLCQRCERLPLRGVDVRAGDATATGERLRLAQVYVALDTEAEVEKEMLDKALRGEPLDLGKGQQRRTKREREMGVSPDREKMAKLPALLAARFNRRLVILGAPGCGKSTFLSHLAFCLAMQQLAPERAWPDSLAGWPAEERDLLPIIVTLRDFGRWATGQKLPQGNAHALSSFLEGWLKDKDLADFAEPLRQMLRDGRAIACFDGLDEIPTAELRALVKDAIADFARTYDKARLVVTCRTLSYQNRDWQLEAKQFPTFTLAPFDEAKIDRFIGAWYDELAALGSVRAEDVATLAGKLRQAVRRPDLWRLAPNPLLLTVMALVHAYRGRLPESRALLYEECTDLLLWRWEEVKMQAERERAPGLRQLLTEAGLQEIDLKRALWALAFAAHSAGGGGDDSERTADINENDLLRALRALHPKNSWDWAAAVVQQIKERAGLLVEREPEVYAFPHRTFQEYLAGSHLSVQAEFPQQAAALTGEAAFWREAVLLGVGRLVYVAGDPHRPLALAAELCPAEPPASEEGWRKAWLAGDVLLEIGANRVAQLGLGRDLLSRAQQRLAALLEGGHLSTKERAEAGDVLGRLGDPRPGVGVAVVETLHTGVVRPPTSLPMPDILWVEVPAGLFWMGGSAKGEPHSHDDEEPRHEVNLLAFLISRYPITNAQFRPFVEGDGYKERRYWTEAGWAWRQKEKRDRPDWWDDPRWGIPNRPVVTVTWYEAAAYCRWLEKQLQITSKLKVWRRGQVKILSLQPSTCNVQLPSEAEWEKAARGADGRRWPWGDEWEEGRANTGEAGIGETSAVGAFPAGASPYGALDMVGNVWEWTRSRWGRKWDKPDYVYPYQPADGREDLSGSDHRVVRGGSWNDYRWDARCASRVRSLPASGLNALGLRVVVSLAF